MTPCGNPGTPDGLMPLPQAEHRVLAALIRARSAPLTPQPTGLKPRLALPRPPKAILCDVYGTLFISGSGDIGVADAESRVDAVLEALAECGLPGAPVAARQDPLGEVIRRHHARRRQEGVAWPEVDIEAVWDEMLRDAAIPMPDEGREILIRRLAVIHECRTNPVWPMPHLAETLAGLRTSPLLLGIVSNAQFYTPLLFPAFLDMDLSAAGFAPDLCAWSWQGREAKPSTTMFRAAADVLADRHGLRANEILYLGNDMRNDIQPAAALGMMTALFAGDARSLRLRQDDATCRKVVPNAVVTSLADLVQAVL